MAALADIVEKDSTNRSVTVRIIDDTDGTPETGAVYNSTGIDLWYRREGGLKVSITEVDLATPALDDAHTDGGFLHIANGEYRLDLPDAAFADGANYVDFGGEIDGMIVIGGRVRLVDLQVESYYTPADVLRVDGDSAASTALWATVTGAGYDSNVPGTPTSTTVDLSNLSPAASAVDDAYVGWSLRPYAGTGAGQIATITAYDGTTKIATFAPAMDPVMDNTSDIVLAPNGLDVQAIGGVSVDAMVTDPTAPPSWTGGIGLAESLAWMTARLLNKNDNDGDKVQLYAADGVTVIAEADLDPGATSTFGAWTTP